MIPKQIHEEAFVLDSHCDTPLQLQVGRDISKRSTKGHVDLDRMKEGGVDASFFAIYVSNKWDPNDCTYRALDLIARVYDFVQDNHTKVSLVTTPAQAREAKSLGKRAIFLGMENGGPFHENLSLLRLFFRMGIRYVTLTHAGNNQICDSCAAAEPLWNGLSPFGKQVVAEMNRLGMLVDVAHISDKSFYDVLETSAVPVVSTHSCCRALCDVPRNMTDQMIRDLAAKGGVIQINFYPSFLDKNYAARVKPVLDLYDEVETQYKLNPYENEEKLQEALDRIMEVPRPSYKRIVDHIDHVVDLVGTKHVGIGSDFDGIEVGPEGMEDISCMPRLTEELCARGYSRSEIEDILGGNFIRVLEQVQNAATCSNTLGIR